MCNQNSGLAGNGLFNSDFSGRYDNRETYRDSNDENK